VRLDQTQKGGFSFSSSVCNSMWNLSPELLRSGSVILAQSNRVLKTLFCSRKRTDHDAHRMSNPCDEANVLVRFDKQGLVEVHDNARVSGS